MGHLFFASGPDPRVVRSLTDRAALVFASAVGVEPQARHLTTECGVLAFPSLRVGRNGFRAAGDGSGWACASGAWTSADGDPYAISSAFAEGAEPPLRTLDGSFVIAWQNAREPGPSVVTDRIGTLHCYATTREGTILVSTSSLALAILAPGPWDTVGLAEFLGTGTVFEDRTLFRDVKKLDRGTLYRFRDGRLAGRSRYWDVRSIGRERPGTVEELAQALIGSLRVITATFGKPIVDLTGGYDSRAVLAAMLRVGGEFETVVNGAPDHPDVRAANAIAQRFGLTHRHQTLPPDWGARWWERANDALVLCDGEYDILEYARTLEFHSRLAVPSGVSVNGSGGEFAKGYWWELLYPRVGARGSFDALKVAARRFAVDDWSRDLLATGGEAGLVEHFASVIERENAALGDVPNTMQMDNVYLALRMQRWQGRIASATNQIWPAVSPFMFREPLEIALSALPEVRMRNRMSCRLNEHLHAELAAMPLAQGYPASPMRPRNLHRFLPLVGELARKSATRAARMAGARRPAARSSNEPDLARLLAHEEVRDHLRPRSMRTRELYRPERLSSFLDSIDADPRPERIGRLLTLERLARMIEGCKPLGA